MARINTTASDILTTVQTNLLAQVDGSGNPYFHTVALSITPLELLNIPDDQYAYISIGRQNLAEGPYAGGGSSTAFVDGELLITIWTRLALDSVPQDTIYLTDASLGALHKMHQVITYLSGDGSDPLDSNSNFILAEPMRFKSVRTPEKTNIPGWGYTQIVFEMHYSLDFSA